MFITESFQLQLDDLLERICPKLQITPAQHQSAQGRYETIGEWLADRESPLARFGPVIYPQGSLRIGTTVRPRKTMEYDLDLVCEVQLDWRQVECPVALLDLVEWRLKQHDTYKPMLERKNRCIRVKYANEFHLDILPACPDLASGNGCVVVPDREAKEWKASNPKGYAAWFESRAKVFKAIVVERVEPLPGQEPTEVKAPLKRVVQLMKRWRDIAYAKTPDIAPISIVLTTLAGHHYGGQQSVNEALTYILNGVVTGLPPRGQRLIVLNPTNQKEDLSERWDENPNAYQAFVSGIVTFQQLWREVNQRRGIHQIAVALEVLFGENPTRSAVKEQAEFVEKLRSEQKLGVQTGSGILSSVTSVGSIPLRRNTFHGG